MDGLKSRGQVIVIAATNRPDYIDPALRRPGRFDREIEIPVPDKEARYEILQIHTRGMPLDKDVDLKEIANLTHGFTGADLSALTKEAALKVLRRTLPQIDLSKDVIPEEVLNKLKITRQDFLDAIKEITPSALREVYIEKPNVKWEDIGGLEEVKREIREAVELPLKVPELYEKVGIRTVKGILLYGPPGTGKTLLAKAVANESEANFIAINGPEILSKWYGESEKTLRDIFKKARQAAPCIVFIDEIDSIAPIRGEAEEGTRATERIVNTLLTEMDGLKEMKNVIVIAATNRIDMLDPALLRAGRFDKIIEIPMPDKESRKKIFEVHVRKMSLDKDVDLEKLAELTEGFTGADIENLVREAGMNVIREKIGEAIKEKDKIKTGKIDVKVKMEHFMKALEKIKESKDKKSKEVKLSMYR
jgi:transitional endoplasmic reticulum ATPase